MQKEIDVKMIDEMYEEKERGEEVVAYLDDNFNITHYTKLEVIA